MPSVIAAVHLDNFLFLLLVGVAVLFQFLAKAAGKASKGQTKRSAQTPPPIARAPRESDEEKIRKLLEALGRPSMSKPPPTVVPRTDVPPRPLAPVQPPTVHPPIPWQLSRQERRKRPSITKETPQPRIARTLTMATTSGFEVHEGPLPGESLLSQEPAAASAAAIQKVSTTPDSRTGIATILASKSSLRDAIILREILGPPLGLRAMNSP